LRNEMGKEERMIVIGMGSGRSGTKSLAKLLDHQDNAEVTHEYEEPLHWDLNSLHWQLFEDRIEDWDEATTEQFFDKFEEGEIVETVVKGDVASWYLPYVEEMVREGIEWLGNVKVIALKRDRSEVIESFDEWTGQGNRWQKKGGDWPEYDNAFPTYSDDLTKRDAIGEYYDEYYETCEWLEDVTDFVKVFDIDVLNSEEGQQKLFDFLGIDGKTKVPCKFNER